MKCYACLRSSDIDGANVHRLMFFVAEKDLLPKKKGDLLERIFCYGKRNTGHG
ncbi:MAG: hypothetical protein LBT09_07720 [Planctomycetaceae bacterium]|jgi:hypothetical protein|nr:hypothetical protein [Planctomycetaceae bacterium]